MPCTRQENAASAGGQLSSKGAAESMGMPSMHQTGGLLRAKVGREVAAGSCRYMAALNACGQVGAGK